MEISGAQAAYRVLDILSEIAFHEEGLTVTEVASALSISVPTAHRLLKVLCDRGFIRMSEAQKRYVKASQYGFVTTSIDPDDLVRLAMPALEELQATTGETVFLSQRKGLTVKYLACLPSQREIRLVGAPGMSLPLHASSQGKVALAFSPPNVREKLLAHLEMTALTEQTIVDPTLFEREIEVVKAQGFATNYEEHELGTHSVSVPILNIYGNAVAIVCVGGPKFRVTRAQLTETFAAMAINTAGKIAAVLP